MKKISSLLLVIILVFILSACRQNDQSNPYSTFDGGSTFDEDGTSSINGSFPTNNKKCSALNCKNYVYNNSLYCFEHKCIIILCENKKCNGFDYCTEHKCKTSTCPYTKCNGDFCSLCALLKSKNQNETSNNTVYREKCHVDGCNDTAFNDGVCVNHALAVCQEHDCYKLRVNGSGYCVDHTCHYNGCTYKADGLYCIMHLNQLQNEQQKQNVCNHVNCQNKPETSSLYCKTHKCNIASCPNEKFLSSNYCSVHTCSYGNCKNSTSGYVSNTGGTYCSVHKCKVAGCYNMKLSNSNYCAFHALTK